MIPLDEFPLFRCVAILGVFGLPNPMPPACQWAVVFVRSVAFPAPTNSHLAFLYPVRLEDGGNSVIRSCTIVAPRHILLGLHQMT
jgi:hypothetical protein